jgi:hypothetical protein
LQDEADIWTKVERQTDTTRERPRKHQSTGFITAVSLLPEVADPIPSDVWIYNTSTEKKANFPPKLRYRLLTVGHKGIPVCMIHVCACVYVNNV